LVLVDEEEESTEEEEEVVQVLEVKKPVGKTPEEIEEELFEILTLLLNDYITLKAQLKHERKRNAYYQDRIYRTSVRKGIIVESLIDESATAKKKKKRKCIPAKSRTAAEDAEDKQILEGQGEGGAAEAGAKKKRKRRRQRANEEEEEGQTVRRGFIGENFQNQAKYTKFVRKIIKLQRLKAYYLVQHQIALDAHAVSRTGKLVHNLAFGIPPERWEWVHSEFSS